MCAARGNNGLTAAFWLASLALLLRALLSGGVMLTPAGGGWGASVVLCSATAPMLAAPDHATGSHPDKATGKADAAPCAFAGLAVPHLPGSEPGVPSTVSESGMVVAAIATGAVSSSMPAPPPPSQAPPAAAA